MNKEGQLQISFGWLFALIVGAFILFLAIYGVTKLMDFGETKVDAETAKEIGILTHPLEMGIETGKKNYFILPAESRVYNRCNTNGIFGRQIIKISQMSFNEWTDTGINVGFSNKYIFSEDFVQGKKFWLFSKKFDFPFKIADLIILTSADKNYCFVSPPTDIENEISNLNLENVKIDSCADGDVQVCFAGDCDINVDYNLGFVEKGGEKMDFVGDALMYAAIFSVPEVYECQLRRLMQRTRQLAKVYDDKATFVAQKDCNTNLDLLSLKNAAEALDSSADLDAVNYFVEDIEDKNKDAGCKLF